MSGENEDGRRSEATGGRGLYGDYISNPLMNDDASDWSALHDAAIHGNLLSLQQLIRQGQRVNLLTMNRVTPLHEACLGGHASCAKYLLEHGAKVNGATIDWNTPLYNACCSGSVDCVKILLQNGAKPLEECDLASPIHEAAKRGHTGCIEMLLNHGVEIERNNKYMGTPFYAACENQQMDSVKKLLGLGWSTSFADARIPQPAYGKPDDGCFSFLPSFSLDQK